MTSEPESALQFPCRFPIKAMGSVNSDIKALVCEIAACHDPAFTPAALRSKTSSGGRYVSVTVDIHATSREQLDAIYRALTAREEILMVL